MSEQTTSQRWPGDDRFSGGWADTVTIDGVVYHPHPNGGGLVAETATVAESALVGVFAQVYGNARVLGEARVYGEAQVSV